MVNATIRNVNAGVVPLSPRSILVGALVADILALVSVMVVALSALVLLLFDIDITGFVASHMTGAADVLSAAAPNLLVGWLLYTYLYICVSVLIVAPVGQRSLADATWAWASRHLAHVMSQMAVAWHHRAALAHFLFPLVLLRHLGHDYSADPVSRGWNPGLHPALTYESSH